MASSFRLLRIQDVLKKQTVILQFKECLFIKPMFHEHVKRNDVLPVFLGHLHTLTDALNTLTESRTMLQDACLVLLPLVAQTRNDIENNAKRQNDTLNGEEAIFLWFPANRSNEHHEKVTNNLLQKTRTENYL